MGIHQQFACHDLLPEVQAKWLVLSKYFDAVVICCTLAVLASANICMVKLAMPSGISAFKTA
jgi:hypothetical protein